MSKAQFSRHVGVTKMAITKAVREGRVVAEDDGTIDPERSENLDYSTIVRSRAGGSKIQKAPRPSASKVQANVALMGDDDTLSTESAIKLKTLAQIQHTHVKTLELRKELISKELVQRVFSKMYMVDQNEFKPIAAKVAPNIAAVFGSNDSEKILATTKIIEDEIYKCLNHKKRIIDDFLKAD